MQSIKVLIKVSIFFFKKNCIKSRPILKIVLILKNEERGGGGVAFHKTLKTFFTYALIIISKVFSLTIKK